MGLVKQFMLLIVATVVVMCASGCGGGEEYTSDGKLIIHYWEAWTGFEAKAMQEIVDAYNASQDKVHVKMLQVSELDRKLLLATAGGNPPDVSGLPSASLAPYAEKGALTPLSRAIEKAGLREEDYIASVWKMCKHRGVVWALPTTPATLAMHWNKGLYREGGIDPNYVPRSIEELEEISDRLTIVELMRNGELMKVRYPELTEEEKRAKDFRIIQAGHLPHVPGWYSVMWGYWFNGRLVENDRELAIDSDANLRALKWYMSYADKFGLHNIQKFTSSCGNFATPQDAFLSGKVAIVLQGVWMHNFIKVHGGGMEWGAAAFPCENPNVQDNVTVIESNLLIVPRGSKHAKEAFDFIRFVQRQEMLEKLNSKHVKFSPLRRVSDAFYETHPHPYIKVFEELARSKDARITPQTVIWNELRSEMNSVFERAQSKKVTPEAGLERTKERLQRKLDQVTGMWDAVKIQRVKEWQNDQSL